MLPLLQVIIPQKRKGYFKNIMSKYIYKGAEIKTGKATSGIIDAKNEREAVLILRSRDIHVKSIKRDWKSIEIRFRMEKIKIADIAVASRQLATMIAAGLPLARSIEIIGSQTSNRKLRSIFDDIKIAISEGSTFHEALQKHKDHFGDLYVSLVKAGEIGGSLDTMLDRLAIYQEKSLALRRKVKSAITYPVTVVFISVAVLTFLMLFVVPKFAEIYEDFGAQLPALTMVVINTSKFIGSWHGGGIILGTIMLLIVTIRFLYKKTNKGRYAIDYMLLKLPKIGGMVKKVSISRFTRSMGTLLRGGVSLLSTMDIVGASSGNKVIEKSVIESKKQIESGKSLSEPMRATKLFPPMVNEMIYVGEETGNLDDMLMKVADYYEDEVDRAVEGLTSMVEPILIVFLGVIVGFIVIALYLPIFKLGEYVK